MKKLWRIIGWLGIEGTIKEAAGWTFVSRKRTGFARSQTEKYMGLREA
jgi:hypothetical protein